MVRRRRGRKVIRRRWGPSTKLGPQVLLAVVGPLRLQGLRLLGSVCLLLTRRFLLLSLICCGGEGALANQRGVQSGNKKVLIN